MLLKVKFVCDSIGGKSFMYCFLKFTNDVSILLNKYKQFAMILFESFNLEDVKGRVKNNDN